MDYPIVFIPGLFGSMGDDVIKGTGDFSFGFAERIYRPFIQILNSMGYIEGLNLFISYYDWRKSVLESVDKYLLPTIEMAKNKTSMDKVIIIGHSLGGLLGRAYITYFSPSSVDKLIMIGTPNLGAVNAYYFWSGGKLPYAKVEDNILYNGLKLGFILYYHLFHNINYIGALRDMFPVAKDLLPSYRYGNYLYHKENGIKREISIDNMSINNEFLNRLNNEYIDKDKLFIISGKGIYTNKEFVVGAGGKEKRKWEDGKPIESIRTNQGDGTVTTNSTLGYLGGNNIVLEGNHTSILCKSKDYLARVLGKTLNIEVKEETIEKVYFILADNCNDIMLGDNRVQTIKISSNKFLIMVADDKNLECKLDIDKSPKFNPKTMMATVDRDGINILKYKI